MAGMYGVRWNVPANRLEFALSGLFDEKTWHRWDVKYRAALCRPPAPEWSLLGDLTGFPAQDDEVQRGAGEHMRLACARGCVHMMLVFPDDSVAAPTRIRVHNLGLDGLVTVAPSLAEARRLLSAGDA